MAAKKPEVSEERIYTIPLRKEWLKGPRVKRSNRAANTIKLFMKRHLKATDVKISQKINEQLWERGIHNPPSKIKVKAKKDDKGLVKVMLIEEVEEIKKEEKKGRLQQIAESKGLKIPGGKDEKPSKVSKHKEEVHAEKKEETKPAEGSKEPEKKQAEKFQTTSKGKA